MKIEIRTPQFDRSSKESVPVSSESIDWEGLRKLTKAELFALGCRPWDGLLMLFPHEWYAAIPEGFEVASIAMGNEPYLRKKFVRGETDDDKRFGCLAYGVEAADGERLPYD